MGEQMTKAGLEKEAEKSLDKRLGTYAYIREQDCYRNYVDGYTDGAEPREKQIDELKAQIKVLEQNLEDTEICENGLKNRIAELEDKLANADYQLEGRDLEIKELEEKVNGVEFINKQLNEQLIQKSDTNHQLVEQNTSLLTSVENLNKSVQELETQLEREKNLSQCMSDNNEQLRELIGKMKRHSNCKHRSEYNEFDPYSKVCQSCCNLEKWEFGEIKEK